MIRQLLARRGARRGGTPAPTTRTGTDGEDSTPMVAPSTGFIEARSADGLMTLLISASDAVRGAPADWWDQLGVTAAAKVLHFDVGERLVDLQAATAHPLGWLVVDVEGNSP